MKNFAKTFVSNMANGDIFYSRLSFGTIQQQFFGIFQFLKGGEFFLPPPWYTKVKKNVGTQRVKEQFLKTPATCRFCDHQKNRVK